MGFWSTLGTIGGLVAAPFTGGASAIPLAMGVGGALGGVADSLTGKGSSGPSPASAVGQTAGSIEQQRMNGLIQQAKLQQEQDQLGLNRTNAGVNVGNLNLAQQKQALSAPGTLANQSVRGDILANSQDASFSGLNPKIHMPTMTGGLRPSMMSDSTRALGAQMSRNALADSTSGKYTTMAPLPTIPGATPLPEANAYDKILQGTATGAGFLDALKGVQMPGGVDAGSPQHAEEDTRPPTDQNMGDPGMDPELEAWLKSQQEGVG